METYFIGAEEGIKYYAVGLLLAALGALCILGFLIHKSLNTVMMAGAALVLMLLGTISLLWGIYLEYEETGSLKEALGLE